MELRFEDAERFAKVMSSKQYFEIVDSENLGIRSDWCVCGHVVWAHEDQATGGACHGAMYAAFTGEEVPCDCQRFDEDDTDAFDESMRA